MVWWERAEHLPSFYTSVLLEFLNMTYVTIII